MSFMEQQHHHHHPQLSFIRSFCTRSTIYNQHKARRLKTLQARNNKITRLRVLAQIPGSRSILAPKIKAPSAAATTDTAAASKSSSKTPSEPGYATTSDLDGNVFTLYNHVPPTAKLPTTASSLAVALCASAGARLADEVLFRVSTLRTSVASSWSGNGPSPMLFQHDGSGLAIFRPKLNSSTEATVSAGETTILRPFSTLLGRNSLMVNPQSSPVMVTSPSMVPVFVLFGTQASVERKLLSLEEHGTRGNGSSVSAASIAASGVAGAAVGIWQHGMRVMIGSQVMASILYFGSYRLLKNSLMTTTSGSSGSYADAPTTMKHSSSNFLAIGVAGAVAGTLSELVRGLGAATGSGSGASRSSFGSWRFWLMTTAASADGARISPFIQPQQQYNAMIRPPSLQYLVVTRVAPAHALLFLGYETALSMLLQTPDYY